MRLSAGCIDTDLPAGRHIFGQSDNALIEIAHMHHAMWVTFGETCCDDEVHGKLLGEPGDLFLGFSLSVVGAGHHAPISST